MLAPALFCGLLLVPVILWWILDERVWPWDPSHLGYESIDLYNSWDGGFRYWLWMFFHGVGNKAPGLIWAAHFFVPVTGMVPGGMDTVLRSLVWISLHAALCLCWLMVRRLTGDSRTAYVSVLFLSGFPFFVAMSETVLMEPMQFAATCAVWTVAIFARNIPLPAIIGLLGMAVSLGLAAKIPAPLFFFVPSAYSAWVIFDKINKRDFGRFLQWLVWLPPALILGATVLLWYFLNFEQVVYKVDSSATGELASRWGHEAGFADKLFFWSKSLLVNGLFPVLWPHQIVLAGMLVVTLFPFWKRPREHEPLFSNNQRLFICLSGVQILLVILFFTQMITVIERLIYAAYVSVIIFISLLIAPSLGGRQAKLYWIAGAVLYVTTHSVHLGLKLTSLGADIPSITQPVSQAFEQSQSELAMNVLNDPVFDGVYHFCGANFDWLNVDTLNYHAAKLSVDNGVRSYFASFGLMPDLDGMWARVHGELGSFVTSSPDYLAKDQTAFGPVLLALRERIRVDQRFQLLEIPGLEAIEIYVNVALKRDRAKQ